MSAAATWITGLGQRPGSEPTDARDPRQRGNSVAGRMRALLRERGPLTAAQLAQAVGLRYGSEVNARLSHDIKSGHVVLFDGLYSIVTRG